ncbi:hypothetical protein [Verrucomicrobium spinosum]|uniref:hypothetical protein n=1 Tax=Verrucomicrobium spinosum TaxID=2736 RepID=UPI00017446C5|nr:hypothetical protein [Verrucomicrobium spinosum]
MKTNAMTAVVMKLFLVGMALTGAGMMSAPAARGAEVQVVHVYVALCDNASQGIIPVPAKIGDGDKPDANLYWGCSDGLKSCFRASKSWKALPAVASPRAEVLERVVFRHATRKDVYLVADAWRGREIKPCLQAFVNAAGATGAAESIQVKGSDGAEVALPIGSQARWLAYIGHNGLMEFEVNWPEVPAGASAATSRRALVLCCIGQKYFPKLGTPMALTTTQLMYPGAFILRDALEVVFDGKSDAEVKAAAARAYAGNQKISVKAAAGVFAVPVGD